MNGQLNRGYIESREIDKTPHTISVKQCFVEFQSERDTSPNNTRPLSWAIHVPRVASSIVRGRKRVCDKSNDRVNCYY